MDAQGGPIRSAHQAAVPAGAVTAAAPCATEIVMRAGHFSGRPGRPGDEARHTRVAQEAEAGRTGRAHPQCTPGSGPRRGGDCGRTLHNMDRNEGWALLGSTRPARRRAGVAGRPGGCGEQPRAGSQPDRQLDDIRENFQLLVGSRQSGCVHRSPGPSHPAFSDSADSRPGLP